MSTRTAWQQMIARCYDPENHKYGSYGARAAYQAMLAAAPKLGGE